MPCCMTLHGKDADSEKLVDDSPPRFAVLSKRDDRLPRFGDGPGAFPHLRQWLCLLSRSVIDSLSPMQMLGPTSRFFPGNL